MKMITAVMCNAVVSIILSVTLNARAEESKQIPIESLVGKYEGIFQSHGMRTFELSYQVDILSVDKSANTVSLIAYCRDCETVKEWKKNNCKITDAKESIKFICKGKASDEEYTFNDGKLKVTGFGKKYPYSINATKVVK